MSQIVRQSNLFAAEDFTKIYKSFQDIDFTAYDFDTIKLALVEYIRVQFPEDFNDYIESSEFIAIIELLAYLGTSLAFRVDLNSRENIMDTAQRRESIIRLARLINYQPKRNLAANGLFKIASIRTDQILTDSVGNSIANIPIFWGDPNNADWFDQFVTILNSSLNPTNPFGRPTKSGEVGGIATDLYELNNILGLNVTQPIDVNVNGETVPVDVVNADFIDGQTFFEKKPDPDEPFGFIYRNDSLGVNSDNSGFFLYFRQGTLVKQDFRYDFPLPNRVQEIAVDNINNSDVYIQEINDQGTVQEQWESVPSVSGSNVIFNSVNFQERNIYEVISELNDRVSVKFADGNFGNTPTGIYRYWYRTSIGRNIAIRPEDASGLSFTIPYTGVDGQTYNLSVAFDLLETVSNGSAAETNEQIKLRAPQTFYTQERMINNEDYNVFPLIFGNEIAKLRAINRTHAGHSRYIDIHDPTGFHSGLIVLGEDGALYNDNEEQRVLIEFDTTVTGQVKDQVIFQLETFIQNDELENFFYNNYLTNFLRDEIDGGFGETYFIFPNTIGLNATENLWQTSPIKTKNDTGYLISIAGDTDSDINLAVSGTPYNFVEPGGILSFVDDPLSPNPIEVSTLIKSVVNNGVPYGNVATSTGPIELSSEIKQEWKVIEVLPDFNNTLSSGLIDDIRTRLDNPTEFALAYDLINKEWYILETPDTINPFDIINNGSGQINRTVPTSWMITISFEAGSGQTLASYELISRGTVTIFESLNQTRFYFDPDQRIFDPETGKSLQDVIEILPGINTTASGAQLDKTVSWTMEGVFIQNDGFLDPSKVEIGPADLNEDGAADIPNSFRLLVDEDDEVVFETFIDLDGYERTRPWVSGWDDTFENMPAINIVAIVPSTPNATADEMGFGFAINPTVVVVALSDADLFMFDETISTPSAPPDTILKIAADLTVFFNGTASEIGNVTTFLALMSQKTLRAGTVGEDIGGSTYWNITPNGAVIEPVEDTSHFGKNGIVFTQDTNILPEDRDQFVYKWRHFAPTDQRIDPSSTNIIDTILLTNQYNNDVLIWKDERGTALSFPAAPTTETLKIQFGELNKFKSISDEIIYNSGKFKLLFGPQAEEELQAVFKAVKITTASISDNELKTRIIQAIDEYFNINNWDFGERFFYTELAAFIHTQLSKFLSSIVIVPSKEESEFGNLFEIVASPDELFLSTATVDNVELVKNYTETNLRL